MVEISSHATIYVLCLPGIKTGGTELLHQLVYELNNQNKNAVIAYTKDVLSPMPDEFKKYGENYVVSDNMELRKDNLLIIPEVMLYNISMYPNIRKIAWWLSVDNFKNRNGIIAHLQSEGIIKTLYHLSKGNIRPFVNLENIQKELECNWVQSYYAEHYLKQYGIKKIRYLSDYLNEAFFDDKKKAYQHRKNNVLYNPKKGYVFTKKLIEKAPYLNWIPIKNLSTQEVYELLRTSKMYVDFGNHPGKDRFPREAVISGCCIITGKRGAAKYYKDIPIKEDYKFDDTDDNIESIIVKIKECLAQYSSKIKDFEEYRNIILNEKKSFIQTLKKEIILTE